MTDITAVPETPTAEKADVEIVVVADRSGSMWSIQADAIGGFNAFITEQKSGPGTANLTVALFDNHYELMQDRVNVQEAILFDDTNFVPRGGTALFDAIGRTVTNLIERKNKGEIDNAIVAILTDGDENASREYRAADIKKLIETCEKDYGWQFVFLAANQDAFATGSTFGISASNAVSFAASGDGMLGATQKMSQYSTGYRSAVANKKSVDTP